SRRIIKVSTRGSEVLSRPHYTRDRARASGGPSARRTSRGPTGRRAIRRRDPDLILKPDDGRPAPGGPRGKPAGRRRTSRKVPGALPAPPSAPRAPIAGGQDGVRGGFLRNSPPGRAGSLSVRPAAWPAGEGVRDRAEGRMVGPGRRGRRTSGETGARA